MNGWIVGLTALALAVLAARRTRAGGGTVNPERPGGGRIRDKRDPPTASLVTRGGVQMHYGAAIALDRMSRAYVAETGDAAGLRAVSGYRSSERQAELFAAAVARYGSPEAARKWVAPPGSSAHQSGRAVDLDMGLPNGSSQVAAQRSTARWRWLDAHAARFGFYAYSAEPWHWEWNPPTR